MNNYCEANHGVSHFWPPLPEVGMYSSGAPVLRVPRARDAISSTLSVSYGRGDHIRHRLHDVHEASADRLRPPSDPSCDPL